jgi:hypothetical protein
MVQFRSDLERLIAHRRPRARPRPQGTGSQSGYSVATRTELYRPGKLAQGPFLEDEDDDEHENESPFAASSAYGLRITDYGLRGGPSSAPAP